MCTSIQGAKNYEITTVWFGRIGGADNRPDGSTENHCQCTVAASSERRGTARNVAGRGDPARLQYGLGVRQSVPFSSQLRAWRNHDRDHRTVQPRPARPRSRDLATGTGQHFQLDFGGFLVQPGWRLDRMAEAYTDD